MTQVPKEQDVESRKILIYGRKTNWVSMETVQSSHGGDRAQRGSMPPSRGPYVLVPDSETASGAGVGSLHS